MLRVWIVLIVLVAGVDLIAANTRAAKPTYLFEVEKPLEKFPHKGSGPYKPYRVYKAFYEKEGFYAFAMTNFEGKFPKPMEYFRNMSVVLGKYLGAKNPEQRYLLNVEGVWVATSLNEQYYFWVLSEPPRIKVVGIKPIGAPRLGETP